jgi:hypothetical protein
MRKCSSDQIENDFYNKRFISTKKQTAMTISTFFKGDYTCVLVSNFEQSERINFTGFASLNIAKKHKKQSAIGLWRIKGRVN